jgi:hypothetical protein
LVPLSDNPKSVADFGITHAFIKEVEKQIYEALNIISGLIKMETPPLINQSLLDFN